MASCLRKKGELDRALIDYNDAIRLEPQFAKAYRNHGRTYLAKGELDRALADFGDAIKIDPNDAFALVERGLVNRQKGNIDRARADLTEAFRTAPTLDHKDGRAALASLAQSDNQLVPSSAASITGGPLPSSAAISSGRRVALVFGESTYQNVVALPNPVNDASDVSAALARLNFTVKTIANASYDDMRRALIEFGVQAAGAEIAVIFFAGHGIQMGGENWLIPIDAHLASDRNVAAEAIGLQMMTRAVSNTSRLGLVILDACRNNPCLPKMQTTNGGRDVDRGFARVEPSDNVLVADSSRDGTVAKDGVGRNSPFTRSLLANIEKLGIDVRFLFGHVRQDVMQATNREQQPYIYGPLAPELIYLVPAR
ncbi:caspase family protein [Bradyrhizobium cenepequi]